MRKQRADRSKHPQLCSDDDSNTPDRYVQLILGATEDSPSTPILHIWMAEICELLFGVNLIMLSAIAICKEYRNGRSNG